MKVEFVIILADQEAWDLALLGKRFGLSDARTIAADEAEAHRMLDVIGKIQQALARKGYLPH